MKKTLVVIFSILIASALLMAAAPSSTKLARLEIVNKTHLDVNMVMLKGTYFYYLTVAPYQRKVFTVEREVYLQTTWSCNKEATGMLDVESNVRLVFTSCYYSYSPNTGTPTIEKIHLNDSPLGIQWRYENFDKLKKFFFLIR